MKPVIIGTIVAGFMATPVSAWQPGNGASGELGAVSSTRFQSKEKRSSCLNANWMSTSKVHSFSGLAAQMVFTLRYMIELVTAKLSPISTEL
jgi:hypothetical protein